MTGDKQLVMDKRHLILLALVSACAAFVVVAYVTSTPPPASSLIKVFICFRHGSRAPEFTYNDDLFNKDDPRYWPEGPGQLTKAGKQELHELGQNLRKRYGEFIGDLYKAEDTMVFSTLKERTLMSAQLFLAGFFPPRGYQEWSEQIPWQPIPVYPEWINNGTNGFQCNKLMNRTFHYYQQNLTSNMMGLTEDVITILKQKRIMDKLIVKNLYHLWESTYFQDRANLPLPDWLSTIYHNNLRSWALYICKQWFSGTNDTWLLVLGPKSTGLLTFFIESTRKLEIHSWIDHDLLSLLLVLGIEPKEIPQPSSAIVAELHQINGDQYFELYYYPNSKTTNPEQLTMQCGKSCTLSQLRNISETLKVDDYIGYCNSGGPSITWEEFVKGE